MCVCGSAVKMPSPLMDSIHCEMTFDILKESQIVHVCLQPCVIVMAV